MVSVAVYLYWGTDAPIPHKSSRLYLWVMLWIAVCCITPYKWFLATPVIAASVSVVLWFVNRQKIELLELPLTYDDIFYFFADFGAVFEGLGVGYIPWLFLSGVFALSGFWLYFNWPRGFNLDTFFTSVIVLATGTIFSVVAGTLFVKQGKLLYAEVQVDDTLLEELWWPRGQQDLQRTLGLLRYLALTRTAAQENQGSIFDDSHQIVADEKAINASVESLISLKNPDEQRLPNIVFLMLESTFDPNQTFLLESAFKTDLIEDHPLTVARGVLEVSTTGGGTNIAEFESIVGIDSRLFGYLGHYTHFTIAPIVQESFVQYLAKKGYQSVAFSSTDYEFFGSGHAFENHYEFGLFLDSDDLELPGAWWRGGHSDTDLIQRIIENPDVTQPLWGNLPSFWFISTIANHAPHKCKNFSNDDDLLGRFSVTVEFDLDCQLSEYLLRMHDSSKAFLTLISFLEEVEAKTGRPFVVVTFGDHQPHTFTEGHSTAFGRTQENKEKIWKGIRSSLHDHTTMYHVVATNRTKVKDVIRSTFHTSFLPSLASAFVARDASDLFLPVNYFAFRHCGSTLNQEQCPHFSNIVASYRYSDVLNLQ